jgi:hypothetical protein
VFENRVLRGIFGCRLVEEKLDSRKLHSEELNKLYYSTNIVRVLEWRIMWWVEHVGCLVDRSGV